MTARQSSRLPQPGELPSIVFRALFSEFERWSFFWDKRSGVWRAAEDDPDSALYAESGDLDTVIGYITSHA